MQCNNCGCCNNCVYVLNEPFIHETSKMTDTYNIDYIIDVVERAATKFPDNIAVIDADYSYSKSHTNTLNKSKNGSVTYSELMHRSELLANEIRRNLLWDHHLGALRSPLLEQEQQLVSIMTNRGIGSIVSILGVLKANAAYVPVDPSFPVDRQVHIFTHSQSLLLVTDEENYAKIQTMNVKIPPVIIIESKTGLVVSKSSIPSIEIPITDKLSRIKNIEAPVYVLYTSGSTGLPKGVAVQQKGLVNIIDFFEHLLHVKSNDRILGLTTLCFDISMLEIFLPLTTGATFIIVSSSTQKNPFRILEVIDEQNVSIMQATPTTYEMLLAAEWKGNPDIHMLVGGEAIRPKVSVLALSSSSKSLTNVYGPTETTIWSSTYTLPNTLSELQAMNNVIPIGKPISKTTFYIVDENMNLMVDGEEGELLIGGDGVALGYLHAPEKTKERFLLNPFLTSEEKQADLGGFIYRTGDLVKKFPDNNYGFIRRMDDQVKVNGYRIELGEVEAAVSECKDLTQNIVLAVNNTMLVCYIVLANPLPANISAEEKDNADILWTKTIQKFCQTQTKLTSYMIPKHVIIVDDIPKTANGKLDRLSLAKRPLPSRISSSTNLESTPANGSISITIQNESNELAGTMVGTIMSIVFQVSGKKVNPMSSFVSVGVDSLAAIMFRSSLRSFFGNAIIDTNSLYNPETTIASFSDELYNSLQRNNPSILQSKNIETAMNESIRLEMINSIPSRDLTLNSLIAGNKDLIDGLRGMAMIFVLYDHFLLDTAFNGFRVHADTYFFLIMTGFTLPSEKLLPYFKFDQEGRQNCEQDPKWDWLQFLTSRFVGLFPMYWIAILICIPRVILVDLPSISISKTGLGLILFMYILALQTWTTFCNTLMTDLYYVSLLWGIMLIFAGYLTILYSKNTLNRKLGWFIILSIALGLTGGYHNRFKPPKGATGGNISPPEGFAYFVLGTTALYTIEYIRRKYEFIKTLSDSSYEDISVSQESKLASSFSFIQLSLQWIYKSINEYIDAFKRLIHTYRQVGSSEFYWALLVDIIAFILLFFLFFNDYHDRKSHGRNASIKAIHSSSYIQFDLAIQVIIAPILFTLLLALSILNIHTYSLFTFIIKKSQTLRLIGRYSLPIYLFHVIILKFYFARYIAPLIQKTHFSSRVGRWDSLTLFSGIIITIIFSVIIQTYFQGMFITNLYNRCREYWKAKSKDNESLEVERKTTIESSKTKVKVKDPTKSWYGMSW